MDRPRGCRASVRSAAFVLVLGMTGAGIGSAHPTTNGYRDSFDTLGPLPSGTGDPWQVTSGSRWEVTDQPVVENASFAGMARVLQQNTRATTPNEPFAFVRGRSFRSFTAQVKAAILDGTVLQDLNRASEPPPGSSVGIVFRAPILGNGLADTDNLYLFAAIQTGIVVGFPTGKAFALFKRIGRGYYLVDNKIAHTFANLRDPHEYKIVMTGGHMQAFVDGRLVIDHTDIPSPDEPTAADSLPGVPFDAGAVGLRSSSARVWFDDFVVIGTDAFEGRAQALDTHFGASANLNPRRGVDRSLSLSQLDTGFVYHDHDFDDAIVRPVEGPNGGQPSAGVSLRTVGAGGIETSTARLTGVDVSLDDPTGHVDVTVKADVVEALATASCTATTSKVNLYNANLFLSFTPQGTEPLPDQEIGPIPLRSSYAPNTVVYEQPGVVKIIAHPRLVSSTPRRIDAALLKVVFPEAPVIFPKVSDPRNNQTLIAESTVATTPKVELTLGRVVAGKYCP